MFLVIHETSVESLFKILDSNILYKSSEIQKRVLKKGQGSNRHRILTNNPSISLTDPNFAKKYDEVDAVYCRLLRLDTKIEAQFGDCILVFDSNVLKNYNFVLNTIENFGFQIAKNKHTAISQFSGDLGLTITSYKDLDLLKNYDFNPYWSEIAFLSNISLSYLRSIFVKEKVQSHDLITKCRKKNIQIYTI
jgi:hypothetical protein